jgi:ppGpp synthetase/RelA/SpoT-type nucleotidyltranferase
MTKSQVNKLGKELRKFIKDDVLPSNELLEKLQDYRTSFKSDLSPVFEIISEVAKGTRSDSITAFRIKRIESILSKIKRQPTMSLGNMGDIAGCRILVHNENSIPKLISELNYRFIVKDFNDYLKETKDDGYRGYHLYIESPINPNKLIEIQIRTVKSHKWASMVEIIDILYNLKIKEGQKHPDFERFLFLQSKIDRLTFDEKREVITIDDKHKVHSKFNEVFIKNNTKIRMDWFGHIGKKNNFFIIEVDKNKTSNISSFETYEVAENTYFEKFKLKNQSNFVLTHIEKPNFKRVCIAYASYVLINHDYLNDWYKLAKDILNDLILSKNSKDAEKYKLYIQNNLTEQLDLLKKEVKEIREYRKDETHNLDGYEEWLEEIKERLVDIAKIAIEHSDNQKERNKWLSWLKG